MWGQIAAAVAPSLIGGMFNRSENRRREERADPANVRKRFEAAGFNPLLGVGAMNAPVQYGPTMGDAIMDAGSMALGQFNREKHLEIQRAELEMANQRLTELAEQSRLRPTYPGPYQGERYDNSSSSGGQPSGVGASSGGDRDTPGLEPYSDRPTEVRPHLDEPATIQITTPGGNTMTSVNPDAWPEWDQAVGAGLVWVGDVAHDVARHAQRIPRDAPSPDIRIPESFGGRVGGASTVNQMNDPMLRNDNRRLTVREAASRLSDAPFRSVRPRSRPQASRYNLLVPSYLRENPFH